MRVVKFFGVTILLFSILPIMYGGLSYKMDTFAGIRLAGNKGTAFSLIVIGIAGIIFGSSLFSKEERRKKKIT